MIFEMTIPCLDLEQIAHSGQCFRMTPVFHSFSQSASEESAFQVISRGRILFIRQEKERIFLDCEEKEFPFWRSYFDCETDYEAMIASIHPDDTYLKSAAQSGRGIRILRQEPWEMMITFLISQQKTIPNIRALVESLSRHYGTPVLVPNAPETTFFAFPTPEELSRASLDDLLNLKLGYRAKYIHQLCKDALSGKLDFALLEQMDYADAMEYLTGFYGIGKKVANCICLFGLHHIDAFPVDTWIEKILMEHYYKEDIYSALPKSRLYDTIIRDCFGRYQGYAGVMQQYIFHYERTVLNQKKS